MHHTILQKLPFVLINLSSLRWLGKSQLNFILFLLWNYLRLSVTWLWFSIILRMHFHFQLIRSLWLQIRIWRLLYVRKSNQIFVLCGKVWKIELTCYSSLRHLIIFSTKWSLHVTEWYWWVDILVFSRMIVIFVHALQNVLMSSLINSLQVWKLVLLESSICIACVSQRI